MSPPNSSLMKMVLDEISKVSPILRVHLNICFRYIFKNTYLNLENEISLWIPNSYYYYTILLEYDRGAEQISFDIRISIVR